MQNISSGLIYSKCRSVRLTIVDLNSLNDIPWRDNHWSRDNHGAAQTRRKHIMVWSVEVLDFHML